MPILWAIGALPPSVPASQTLGGVVKEFFLTPVPVQLALRGRLTIYVSEEFFSIAIVRKRKLWPYPWLWLNGYQPC